MMAKKKKSRSGRESVGDCVDYVVHVRYIREFED